MSIDPRGPRFAAARTTVVLAAVVITGSAAGSTLLAVTAASAALGAAFLNAAFGICLGCEVYLLARRVTSQDFVRSDGTEPTDRSPHSHTEVAA